MAIETVHVVQSFSVNEFGEYAADDPRAFKSAEAAKEQAKKFADRGKPVIAFSRTGDPKIGDYADPEIIVRLGEIPIDVLEAFCGEGS